MENPFQKQRLVKQYDSTHDSRQFTTTSAEVIPNGSLVRDVSPKMALNQVKDL